MSQELEYFNGQELPAKVWRDKYALDSENTPDDMHKRMAKEFARIEEHYINQREELLKKDINLNDFSRYFRGRQELTYDRIYELFKDFKYIVPQGSVMGMLGNKRAVGSLSNCFVIGRPEDSYGGIMAKDQELAQLMKRRGGVGMDISSLRPKGVSTKNAAKTSTGAASFMHRFSNTTREVAQSGRRGALMLTMDVRHPDIFEFVNAKQDRTKVTGANISVMLRDDFMNAVKNDEDYVLTFPCDFNRDHLDYLPWQEYKYGKLIKEVNNHTKKQVYLKKIRAKKLYDQIVHNAWDNAEPGQMFMDRHLDYAPDGVYEDHRFLTTNPCGEIGMAAYDACRLMALNLFSFVKNPYTDDAEVDYDLLYAMAYEQQRLADDLVDLELEHIERILQKIDEDPEPTIIKQTERALWEKIMSVAKASRRTGSGFTALGDMIAALGLKYDSDEAKTVIEKVMKTKMEGELDSTIDMAIERGSFEDWDYEKEFAFTRDLDPIIIRGKNGFFRMMLEEFPEKIERMVYTESGRRNISWSTVAPTGSVSILTQTTSGMEPLFKPYYIRRKKVNPDDKDVRVDFVDDNGDNWMEYFVLHKKFEEWIRDTFTKQGGGVVSYGYGGWTEEELKDWYKKSPWYNSCADDIDWIERVEIQSIIQKYTSHSISSTLNVPEDITEEEISNIYIESYERRLKGVTVYRENCRSGVLVNKNGGDSFPQHDAPERPKKLPVDVHHLMADGKRWTILIGLFENKPYEVFGLEGTIFGKYNKGFVIKEGGGQYTFANGEGEDLIKEDITKDMSIHQEDLTRSWSGALRHGMPVQYLAEQLQKNRKEITAFSKAIARTLAKYVPEEDILNRSKCTECGSTNVRMEEGCVMCNDCGSSACG